MTTKPPTGTSEAMASCMDLMKQLETFKRLLDEQVSATEVVTKELRSCYAELGIYRHPNEPDRGPDAIRRLRQNYGAVIDHMTLQVKETDRLRAIVAHIDKCVMCQNQGTANCSDMDCIRLRAIVARVQDVEGVAKVLALYDDEGDPDCPPQIASGEWRNEWAKEKFISIACAVRNYVIGEG